jgi:hypothetical protein
MISLQIKVIDLLLVAIISNQLMQFLIERRSGGECAVSD